MENKGWVVSGLCVICALSMVIILLLTGLTALLVLYASEKGDDDGRTISLTGLSETSVEPFSLLRLEGSGFITEGSATSIEFIHDHIVTVPASSVDGSGVEVVVPPFVMEYEIDSVPVDVRVIQVHGGSVITTNKLENLEISRMEGPGPRNSTGLYAMGYLDLSMEIVSSMLLNTTDPAIRATLLSYGRSLADLRTMIVSVHEGSSDSISIKDTKGGDITFDRETLDLLDDLLHNIVTLSSGILEETVVMTRSSGDEAYDRKVDSEIETYRSYVQKQNEIGSMLLDAGAKFCYGMYTTMTGLVGGAALSLSLAAQVAIAVGSSWMTQLASGEIPTASGTVQTAMETIADDSLGVPVIGLIKDPLTLLTKFNDGLEEAKRFRPGEPDGGVLLTAASKGPLDDPRTLFNSGSAVRTLSIPEGQYDIDLSDAIPKVPPGQVSYSGTFDGGASFPRTTVCPQCGSVVNTFDYYVVITGTLQGMVDEKGRIGGTLTFYGEWSATGTPGCPHISCIPSSGPIGMTQTISGRTSSFSTGGSGSINAVTGSMDPDVVTGYLTFTTTDGSFRITYTLTPD